MIFFFVVVVVISVCGRASQRIICLGICALTSCHVPGDPRGAGTNNFFAYPGNIATGEVFVYDVSNMVGC